MNNFCTTCGMKTSSDSLHCENCGQSLGTTELKRSPQKPPKTRQQKITLFSLIGIAVLLIGFSAWATTYHSAGSVEKRFLTALGSKNDKKIEKLAVHEKGKKLQNFEIKALLTLAESGEILQIQSLSNVVKAEKFLGIFNNHKIELVDQYIYYDQMMDELTFSFNKQAVSDGDRTENEVIFGPFSPGIYDIVAHFSNEYGEASYETTVTANDADGSEQYLDLDIPASTVVFEIENFHSDKMKDAMVIINDKEFTVDEYGETEEIGPLLIDGSQTAQTTVTFPWGTTTSEAEDIDGRFVTLEPKTLTEEQVEEMLNYVVDFGELHAQIEASQGEIAAPIESDYFTRAIHQKTQWMKSNDFLSAISLELIEIDADSAKIVYANDQLGVAVKTRYHYNSAFHEMHEEPEFDEAIYEFTLAYLFNEQDKTWHLNDLASHVHDDFTSTHEQKGSGKLHETDKEAIAQQKSGDYVEDIPQFMIDFHVRSVEAINKGDFNHSKHLYTAEGPSFKETKDYIPYLVGKNITEDHIQTTVTNIEEVDGTTFKVSSVDKYIIHKDGKSEEKSFNSIVVLKVVDGELKMHELIYTKEI